MMVIVVVYTPYRGNGLYDDDIMIFHTTREKKTAHILLQHLENVLVIYGMVA